MKRIYLTLAWMLPGRVGVAAYDRAMKRPTRKELLFMNWTDPQMTIFDLEAR